MNEMRTSRLTTILALVAGLGFGTCAYAQSERDALRYSFYMPQGTARSIGIGSALGSVGGDFSSLSVNPAGIGVYRRSELTFSPSLTFNNVSGQYMGTGTDDANSRFTVNNLGIVFTTAPKGSRYDRADWKSVSFAFGFNRIADFNRNYSYRGTMPPGGANTNSSGSMIFEADANAYGINDERGFGYLGWQSYLLDSSGGNFFTVVPFMDGLNQRRVVQERGGISDMVVSLGGNFREKLLLGATLGIPTLRYDRHVTYTETDASGNPNNFFQSFTYTDDLSTTGIGVNLKLGFIYKPTDYFRIGAAIHTPTAFAISEVGNRSLTTNTESFAGIKTANNPENIFDYTLSTPLRSVVSATGIIGKLGFVTADYEYVDYSGMRVRYDNSFALAEDQLNTSIRNTYRGASNFRVGGELRLGTTMMVRAGWGYYGNPYKSGFGDLSRINVSAGLGFRFANTSVDLAYLRSTYKGKEQPYTLPAQVFPYTYPAVPSASLKNRQSNVALTVGFRF